MRFKMKNHEDGFTLIELLIVVVIIGILAAIAIPIYLNQQKVAIRAGVESDVHNLNLSVATYLVAKPDANELLYHKIGTGPATGALTTGDKLKLGTGYTFSNDNTTIRISKSASDLTAGAWNGYAIVASNTGTNNATGPAWTFTYSSTAGTYTETGK